MSLVLLVDAQGKDEHCMTSGHERGRQDVDGLHDADEVPSRFESLLFDDGMMYPLFWAPTCPGQKNKKGTFCFNSTGLANPAIYACSSPRNSRHIVTVPAYLYNAHPFLTSLYERFVGLRCNAVC